MLTFGHGTGWRWDLNELPEEVKLPIMGGCWLQRGRGFQSFLGCLQEQVAAGGYPCGQDRSGAPSWLSGQAALIHRIVDQHLLQENSAFRLMEEEVRANKQTIRELQDERIALKTEIVALHTENRTLKARIAELEREHLDVLALTITTICVTLVGGYIIEDRELAKNAGANGSEGSHDANAAWAGRASNFESIGKDKRVRRRLPIRRCWVGRYARRARVSHPCREGLRQR